MWEYNATVVRWIDADTVSLNVDLGFGIHKKDRFRLARIDAWEMRGVEREKGLVAKAFVEEISPVGSPVRVVTKPEQGKYGRYLAEIYVELDGVLKNIGDLLLENGHAERYGS